MLAKWAVDSKDLGSNLFLQKISQKLGSTDWQAKIFVYQPLPNVTSDIFLMVAHLTSARPIVVAIFDNNTLHALSQ